MFFKEVALLGSNIILLSLLRCCIYVESKLISLRDTDSFKGWTYGGYFKFLILLSWYLKNMEDGNVPLKYGAVSFDEGICIT